MDVNLWEIWKAVHIASPCSSLFTHKQNCFHSSLFLRWFVLNKHDLDEQRGFLQLLLQFRFLCHDC